MRDSRIFLCTAVWCYFAVLYKDHYNFQSVSEIITNAQGEVTGVHLDNGMEINAKIVLSNATPKVTFLDLLPMVPIYIIWLFSVSGTCFEFLQVAKTKL